MSGAPSASVADDTGATQPPSWPSMLALLALLSLLVYCTSGAVILTIRSAGKISARQDTINPEGGIAYAAVLAARTGRLYAPLAAPPYTPQPYGPLFYAVNTVIARASHLDVDVTIRRGRLLAFGCFLLCGVTVYLLDRRLRFSRRDSALAALMLLAQPAFLPWNISMRPDLPALWVMLMSLFFALLEGRLGPLAFVASGVLAALAFLIKQSAVAVPIAVLGILLARRRWTQAASFAAGVAVPLVLAFGILSGRREPFSEHFTSVGHSLWSLTSGARWIMHYLGETSNAVPLAIGAVGFLYAIVADEPAQIIASFALVNLCLAFASIVNLGGTVNYFLPALAGCALLLPFAMRAISHSVGAAAATRVVAIVGLLAATAGGVAEIRDFQLPRFIELQKGAPERLHVLRIISDVPYITMHGRDPELLDPFLMHTLELTKRWDPTPVIASVQRGDFDLAILTCGREICNFRDIAKFGAPLVRALNGQYEVLCTAGDALVLRPRIREVGATADELSSILGEPCVPSPDRAPHLSFGKGVR